MLWALRKGFGIIALVWLLGWLASAVACSVDQKVAGQIIAGVCLSSVVGFPACIWAVLNIISLRSAPRASPPAPIVIAQPPKQVPTSSVPRLVTPAALSAGKETAPASTPLTTEPGVYTYSALGMPKCRNCGQRPAIFYCSTHESSLCLECVAKHDVRSECVYVSTFRAPRPTPEQVPTLDAASPSTAAIAPSIHSFG